MTRKQMLQAKAKQMLDEEGEDGGLCIDHLIKMALWVDANPPDDNSHLKTTCRELVKTQEMLAIAVNALKSTTGCCLECTTCASCDAKTALELIEAVK